MIIRQPALRPPAPLLPRIRRGGSDGWVAGWVGGGWPDSQNLWDSCQRGRPGLGRLQGLELSSLVKGFMEVSSRKLDKPQAPHLPRFCRVSQALGRERLLPIAGRRRTGSGEEGREGSPAANSQRHRLRPRCDQGERFPERGGAARGQSWGWRQYQGSARPPAAGAPPAGSAPCFVR